MTISPGASEPLVARADELAAAGAWSVLAAELGAQGLERILASPTLAYRYAEGLYHTGQMSDLEVYAEAYEAESRASSDPLGRCRALNLAGIAAFELGKIERAETFWDRLLDLADTRGDPEMLARATNNLGAVANLRGRPTRAVAYYRLSLLLYQRLGEHRGLAQSHHNLAVSLRDLGRWDDAVSAFAEAISVAESIDYPPVIVMALISRAELEIQRLDFAVAAALATRGLDLARSLQDPINEGQALRVDGLARGLGGEPVVGKRRLEEALAIARQTENKLLEAETLRDLAALEAASGDDSRARSEQALVCFEALGAVGEVDRLRARLEGEDSSSPSPEPGD